MAQIKKMKVAVEEEIVEADDENVVYEIEFLPDEEEWDDEDEDPGWEGEEHEEDDDDDEVEEEAVKPKAKKPTKTNTTNKKEEPTKRKRERNPEQWKANRRKFLRNTGQEYVTEKGITVRARAVQPKDCSKCVKKCSLNFTEADRQNIHKSYWALGDHELQRIFISGLIEEAAPRRVRVAKDQPSRRSVTRHYFLRNGKKRIQVCMGFFLATLDITEALVKCTLMNRDETTNFPQKTRRGLHANKKRRPEEARERIRAHIRTFIHPAANFEPDELLTKKRWKVNEPQAYVVNPGVNIKRMWEDYRTQCHYENVHAEKEWFYRSILKQDFNIIFSDPMAKTKEDDATSEVFHEIIETSFNEHDYD